MVWQATRGDGALVAAAAARARAAGKQTKQGRQARVALKASFDRAQTGKDGSRFIS